MLRIAPYAKSARLAICADRGHPASTPSVGTTRAATEFVMSDELCKTELCEGASIEACQDFYPRPGSQTKTHQPSPRIPPIHVPQAALRKNSRRVPAHVSSPTPPISRT